MNATFPIMMIKLEALGKRICIIGPSSTGKSTLATSLSQKLGVQLCYLDVLAHVSNTNWQRRDNEAFAADHRAFLDQYDQWVIEGNYQFLMRERFANATAIIWLDYGGVAAMFRYLRRSLKNRADRLGNLPGATQQLSIAQIRRMLFKAPQNRPHYQRLIDESKTMCIRITSFAELMHYYRYWELS